jgi:L-sorbose 1-phosphate reductase
MKAGPCQNRVKAGVFWQKQPNEQRHWYNDNGYLDRAGRGCTAGQTDCSEDRWRTSARSRLRSSAREEFMKTWAVRLYGRDDLRLESFELPAIGEGEILARVISDSICMSTYKAVRQIAHKRVPADVATHPIIIGHEFCGEILAVGSRWRSQYRAGDHFAIQPAVSDIQAVYPTIGYAYERIGGAATHVIIPEKVMACGCLLPFRGGAFYLGSLAEPLSCIIGGFHVNYHTRPGRHEHTMGIVAGGTMALLGGAGPMGLGAIDYALHQPRRPGLLVVTDVDAARLERAAALFPPEAAARMGVQLVFVNAAGAADWADALKRIAGGRGYDDVFVYAPVAELVEQADRLLASDGCLNFFAGPTDPDFRATMNFYNIHYNASHVSGNSGGNSDDLAEALDLMAQGQLNPSTMITHIGGLDSVIDATINLPRLPGGKKLIYNQIGLPLTALADFRRLGAVQPLFRALADIVEDNDNLWCAAAERYLLAHAAPIGADRPIDQ